VGQAEVNNHFVFRSGGEVSELFCPPSTSPLLRRGCFCSIAMDHSLAICSLESFSCLYLIGGHCFPIEKVRWRSADDLLVIGCADGTVNVWQMTTGR
jgi:WD40 repeat protein